MANAHRVQVDTTRGAERLVGELIADRLAFDVAGERQAVEVEAVQYYTNLEARTGTGGEGILYLRDNTVLEKVQLLDDITVRVRGGLTVTRRGNEVVMLNLDTASF